MTEEYCTGKRLLYSKNDYSWTPHCVSDSGLSTKNDQNATLGLFSNKAPPTCMESKRYDAGKVPYSDISLNISKLWL